MTEPSAAVRIDSWIWAVRLVKTRTQATSAVKAGHVKVNGERAKPATRLQIGDRVQITGLGLERDVEVVRLITKRVGPPVAATCVIDHSPPPPPREERIVVAQRDPGAGRPTKRDRRRIDELRGRR